MPRGFKRFAARIPAQLAQQMEEFVQEQQQLKGKGYSQNQLVLEAVANYIKLSNQRAKRKQQDELEGDADNQETA